MADASEVLKQSLEAQEPTSPGRPSAVVAEAKPSHFKTNHAVRLQAAASSPSVAVPSHLMALARNRLQELFLQPSEKVELKWLTENEVWIPYLPIYIYIYI